MHCLQRLSRGGRLLLALAVGGALFGIATAVQADIPDNGVIHGCYGKPGTSYKGQLRVRDASQGEHCRYYENQLDGISAASPARPEPSAQRGQQDRPGQPGRRDQPGRPAQPARPGPAESRCSPM